MAIQDLMSLAVMLTGTWNRTYEFPGAGDKLRLKGTMQQWMSVMLGLRTDIRPKRSRRVAQWSEII
jgi:hypothetical protein